MLENVIDIAREAGAIARQHFGRLDERDISRKSATDLVTRVDKEIEGFLRKRLAAAVPDATFFGEEGDYGALSEHARVFVVDPLDGTTSFIHGHPFYSVSVGYRENGSSQLGVVYLPYFDQVYWAVRGRGAFHDGKRLAVSRTDVLGDALVATGFACAAA